jgi:hypothetical protein
MYRALAAALAAMAVAELGWAMYLSKVGAKARLIKRTPVSRWSGLGSAIAAYSVVWRRPPETTDGVYRIHIDDALDAQELVDDVAAGRIGVLYAHNAALRIRGTRRQAHGFAIECAPDAGTMFGASSSAFPIAPSLPGSTWPARATFFGS